MFLVRGERAATPCTAPGSSQGSSFTGPALSWAQFLMNQSFDFQAEPLDFSQFEAPRPQIRVASLGLKPSESQIILENRYGLTNLMRENFPEWMTKASGALNTPGRVLASFEHNYRQTTYEEMAKACGIKPSSAYQAMLKVRKLVESATDLVFVTKGPLLQITSDQTCAIPIKAAEKMMLKAARPLQEVHRQLQSLYQMGQMPALSPNLQAWYIGYCKANNLLPAGSQYAENME